MNKLSEFIIRLLSPKPKDGEILIMPYVRPDTKGIPQRKHRKIIPPENGGVDVPPSAPPVLPGQISYLE